MENLVFQYISLVKSIVASMFLSISHYKENAEH